jgi:predicted permease
MWSLLQDLRFAVRILTKNPGFTAVAVITLALGVGVNTAIFSLVDAVMMKVLPVQKPEQLVLFFDGPNEGTRISRGGIGDGGRWRYYSYPLYEYLRDHNQFFQGICAFKLGEDRLNVSLAGRPFGDSAEEVWGHLVSGNYFAVPGGECALGSNADSRGRSPHRPPRRPAQGDLPTSCAGGRRLRLIRQMLTESLLVAGLGGALGVLFAVWGVKILVSKFAGTSSPLNVSPDLQVLTFALAICVLAAILLGPAPALRSTRLAIAPELKTGSVSPEAIGRRWSLGKGLVSCQAAVSLLLPVGAGLFVRTLQDLEAGDLGFNRQNVLLVGIDPRLAGYKPDHLAPLYQRLIDRVSVLPGIRRASLADYSPMSGHSRSSNTSIEGYIPPRGRDMDVHTNVVGWDCFETVGTPIVLGRGIGPEDLFSSPKVAVINVAAAHDFFGDRNPIGRRFGFGDDPKHGGDIEIVGVVADAKYRSLRQKPERIVFTPALQMQGDEAYVSELEIRTVGDPRNLGTAVRSALAGIDKGLPATGVTTLGEQVDDSLRQTRTISELSTFFGLLALSLACVGLYGVMAYTAARRTSEMGIRMALGARSRDVLWMMLREALFLVLAGTAVGIPAAIGAGRLISSLLFGIAPADPVTISLATLLLVAVAVLAGYLPARRASCVDPMVALRCE